MRQTTADLLRCPVCAEPLDWTIKRATDTEIDTAIAACQACRVEYPVREGIGVFLTPDMPREDLWEEAHSHLRKFIEERPEVRHLLLERPLEDLDPVDRLYLHMYFAELGDFERAEVAGKGVTEYIYTPEHLGAMRSAIDVAIGRVLQLEPDVVLDVASGEGALLRRLARELEGQVLGSDFSPRVLRRDRRYFDYLGFGDRVDLVAFDVRKPPFGEATLPLATSHMGLANVQDTGAALRALRRVADRLVFTHQGVLPSDKVHLEAYEQFGMADAATIEALLASLKAAGWQTEVLASWRVPARPTPRGKVLSEIQVDAIPMMETELDIAVIEGR